MASVAELSLVDWLSPLDLLCLFPRVALALSFSGLSLLGADLACVVSDPVPEEAAEDPGADLGQPGVF